MTEIYNLYECPQKRIDPMTIPYYLLIDTVDIQAKQKDTLAEVLTQENITSSVKLELLVKFAH